ncbi:MAG: tetratricopeptide repeat protein, partial [Myxococcota bacterium]
AQLGRVYKGRIKKRERKQLELGDDAYRDAIEAYERADELAGGHVGSLVERARLLGAWPGHQTEAEKAFYRAMKVAREKGLRDEPLFVAEAAFEFSRIKQMRRLRTWALREIVRVEPERLSAWQRLARLEDGRSGRGEDVLRELLEVRPDNPAAHVLYATYLTNNGRGDEAIAHLSTTIEDGPDSPILREKLVRVAIEQGQLEAARTAVEAMADEFPDESSTRRAQARVAILDGRREQAAKLLRQLAVESESAETQRLLAIAEHQLGNLPAATAAIDRGMRLSPEFSPAIMRLKARIHHDAEEWRLVLRTLIEIQDRGFELDGRQRLMKVRALYGRGMKAGGAAALDALLAGPNPPAGAAVEYAKREGLRHPGKARRYLLAALARQPRSYELLKVLTRLELRDGRSRAALVHLDRVVESGSAGPLVLLLRAEVLIALNQLGRAEADALRAFEVAPGLPRAADLLFSLYRAQGSLDETRRSFEEAQAAGVLHPGARILLARLYAHQGETVKARETLEDLLADQPQMPLVQRDLALLMADHDGDLDRALELARAAEQALSRSPYTADSLGYVYFRMGRNEAALQQFRNAIDLAKDQSEPIPPPFHYHLGLALRALDRNPAAARHFAKALALDSDFPGAEDARRQLEAARSLDPEATNRS